MIHPKTSIMLIALGSVVVIIGILFYFLEIFGATGMILIGVIIELIGGISFLMRYNKHKKQSKDL